MPAAMAVVPSPSMKQSLNRFYQRWRGKPVLSFEASEALPSTATCTLALPVIETTHGRIEAHVVKSEAPNRKAADAAACKEAWVWLQARTHRLKRIRHTFISCICVSAAPAWP